MLNMYTVGHERRKHGIIMLLLDKKDLQPKPLFESPVDPSIIYHFTVVESHAREVPNNLDGDRYYGYPVSLHC